MSCDVGEVTERLENELCSTVYSSAHSPTLLSLLLRHKLFTWRAASGYPLVLVLYFFIVGQTLVICGIDKFVMVNFHDV